MRRNVPAVALILLLAGCAGLPGQPPVGFVNHTRHPDDALWAIWRSAQQSVEQKVDLNPLQRSTVPSTPPEIRPGDPRAANVQPRQLRVAAAPDVSSNDLLAATGISRADPTGLILCPQPCNVHYSAAYSFYSPSLTRYAASWEAQDNNFAAVLQYEFENHILNALGYDMRWR